MREKRKRKKEREHTLNRELINSVCFANLWCWSWNQYFGHLMRRTDSLEKTLMLGKMEDRWRRGQQMMRWWDGITDSKDGFEQDLGDGEGQGSLLCCSPRGLKEFDKIGQLNSNNRKVKTRSETWVYRMNEWMNGFHSHTLSRNSSWEGSAPRRPSLPIGLASGESMTSCPASPPVR